MRAFPIAPPMIADDEDDDARPQAPRRSRAATIELTDAETAAMATRAMACGVDEIMRPNPPTVTGDVPVAALHDLLLDRHAGCVPVVDRDGRPVGVVTMSDLLRTPDGATAADVMSPNIFALPITAILAQAAALIAYENISEIVIADLHGRVAGMVGALDITRWCARAAGYLVDH